MREMSRPDCPGIRLDFQKLFAKTWRLCGGRSTGKLPTLHRRPTGFIFSIFSLRRREKELVALNA
jgi:hypothetical protein